MVVVGETYADVYAQIRQALLDAPVVEPQGKATKELQHVQFCITNPWARLGFHPDRKFNLPFALTESLMLFAMQDDVRYIAHFNPRMTQFSDNGATLYGAYGPRIFPALSHTITKLREDSESRQAVILIERSDDFIVHTKDVPCTIALTFLIRNGTLHCHVLMRSNDLFLGTQYDVVNFTILQEVVATTLGIPMGPYYHTAISLYVDAPFFDQLAAIETFHPIKAPIGLTLDEMIATRIWWVRMVDGVDPMYRVPQNVLGTILNYAFRKKAAKAGMMHANQPITIPSYATLPGWAQRFVTAAER